MKNKRGQAALEFLTTYGWAFLVILVMIAALSYFGVLNPENYIPDSCNFGGLFSCSGGYALQYDETPGDSIIQVDVTNILSDSVNVTNIKVKEKSQGDDDWVDATLNSTWDDGPVSANKLSSSASDTLNIKLPGNDFLKEFVGKKKIIQFQILYSKGSSEIVSYNEGSITAHVFEV
jgi:hypothetical protein